MISSIGARYKMRASAHTRCVSQIYNPPSFALHFPSVSRFGNSRDRSLWLDQFDRFGVLVASRATEPTRGKRDNPPTRGRGRYLSRHRAGSDDIEDCGSAILCRDKPHIGVCRHRHAAGVSFRLLRDCKSSKTQFVERPLIELQIQCRSRIAQCSERYLSPPKIRPAAQSSVCRSDSPVKCVCPFVSNGRQYC